MGKPIVTGKFEEPYVIGGHVRRHSKKVTGPVSYTTGGDLLDVHDLGDTWGMNIPPCISTDGTLIAYFVPQTIGKYKQVKMFIVTAATGAQVANASDQHLITFLVSADTVG